MSPSPRLRMEGRARAASRRVASSSARGNPPPLRHRVCRVRCSRPRPPVVRRQFVRPAPHPRANAKVMWCFSSLDGSDILLMAIYLVGNILWHEGWQPQARRDREPFLHLLALPVPDKSSLRPSLLLQLSFPLSPPKSLRCSHSSSLPTSASRTSKTFHIPLLLPLKLRLPLIFSPPFFPIFL